VTARTALQKDSLLGDAPQVVVTAKAAETFVNPCAERPHHRRELMTMGNPPCVYVRRRQFFERSNCYRQ
jgi:hypothetical protein